MADDLPYYARPSAEERVQSAQSQGFAFRARFDSAGATCSTFRTGTVVLSASGVLVNGKAVPSSKYLIAVPIPYLHALVGLVRIALQFFRVRRILNLPWCDVQRVVLVPHKRRVALVYDARNLRGRVQTFSLAFALEPALYEVFVKQARSFAPDRVQEGRLGFGVSPLMGVLIVMACVFLMVWTFAFLSAPGR